MNNLDSHRHSHAHAHAHALLDTQSVRWKDLVKYQRFETARELCLPLPWLAVVCGQQAMAVGATGSVQWGWIVAMGIAVIYVFMLGLRVAHNAFHGTLGLTPSGDHWVMGVISVMMLGSSHAINYTHMYHHKHCMQIGDVEGELATLPFGRALFKSPIYPVYIHIVALRDAPKLQKRWILAELAVSALLQCMMLVWFESPVYGLYSLMMLVANLSAPMVGIWAVHRQCEGSAVNARSCRSRVVNFLTCGMFYHAEHHLFPAVPTRHLAELAMRIDATGVRFLGVTELG
jgi:fatty acid desaturase